MAGYILRFVSASFSFLSSLLSPLPNSPPPRTPNKVAIFSLEKARLKAAEVLPAVALALSNNNMINAILLIFDAINVYIRHTGNQQVFEDTNSRESFSL
mmetsp:Transcript_20229/g.28820  ORF Transcript_20229/g.28820 Transcript_20229/m.28820 type:complete len:99 (+) Transcript_20229:931-1227(+)